MSWPNLITWFPYRPRYYLTHPWKFFQELGQNIHLIWQRATKGYAYSDAAEMDEFLLHIIPAMLREIANGAAYPSNDEFPTYEKWQDFCNSLADVFESVQEENWEEGRNKWEEDFNKAFEILHPHPNFTCTSDMTEEEAQQVCKLYWEREKELWSERENIIKDAYAILAKYHGYFWI